MGHREQLLAGAIACLREKGNTRFTARDVVAASGANLGSIGYHYGSMENLINAAVMEAIGGLSEELARAMSELDASATPLERFEQYWTRLLAAFAANRNIWLASFDVFWLTERSADVRAAIADGLQGGRLLWAHLLHGVDDPDLAQRIGSIHQALLTGTLVQWLVDPDRAPSAHDLAEGLRAIADDVR